MEYAAVSLDDIVSPVDENLYELVNGSYILSLDEEPDPDKIYYMLIEEYEEDDNPYFEADVAVGDSVVGLYEYVNDEYVLTQDTVALDGKTYWEYVELTIDNLPDDEDALYYPVSDPVDDPAEAGLYEKTDTGYVLTEDTVFDEEKQYYGFVEPEDYETLEEEDEEPIFDFEDLDDIMTSDEEDLDIPVVGSENFLFAYLEFVDDPSAEGFYEVVNGVYVLTQDTEIVEDKVYYEYAVYSDYYEADMTGVESPVDSMIKYYELSGGMYVRTEDSTVVSGKTYYRSHIDDENPYVPDPMIGEEPARWEDIPIGE